MTCACRVAIFPKFNAPLPPPPPPSKKKKKKEQEKKGKQNFYQVHTTSGSRGLDFCCFCSKFLHNLPKRAQNHPNRQYIFSRNNLNHLENTLGNLEPQLQFYHRDGVDGFPLGPGS